ncbi:MAG TPA: hypothetical protein VL996_01050 [Methylocella sp.]|nr:hypothetical protein [Methylocella sp.]
MHVNVPKLDIQQAGLSTLSVGQVAIGPITVSELVLNDTNFALTGAQGLLKDVNVTITIKVSVDWHVHVGLPWPLPDIDVGDTYDLGSLSFPAPVGDIALPSLNNVHINIPALSGQNLSVSANPLSLDLQGASADQIGVTNVTLPSAGFTLAGLQLNSVEGEALSVPAAKVDQATIHHVHAAPIKIPAFTLGNLNLPALHIPQMSSSAPLDIPADLQSRSIGFDAGILRLSITLTPSALSHIDRLEISNANANATVGQIVLHNVELPFDALNLTLSQIGITSITIPAFTVT